MVTRLLKMEAEMNRGGVKEYSSLLLEGLPSGWFKQRGEDEAMSEATKVHSPDP